MNLSVTGHHLAITPAIRGYVESKLERILRHFDHVIDVHVILSIEKLRQHAEVALHVRGKDIFVEADHENMYAAIDALVDKLDRAVMKHKGRAYSKTHVAIKHYEIAQR
jgi:putative sigma-54 modulation protein